jgi:hypothetical protein
MRRRAAWNAGLDGAFLDHGTVRRVLDGLGAGRTLAQVCRAAWAPSPGTFYNWLKRYPGLRAEYALAKSIGADVLADAAWEDAPWLGSERASEVAQRRATRAAERRGRRLAAKRYATPVGPVELVVEARDPGQAQGEGWVVYPEVRPR